MDNHEISRGKKILQIICAVIWCLLAAGPVFGFAAIKPIFVKEGVYEEYCTPDEIKRGVPICTDQELRLNFIFTCAAVSTNVSAVIVGSVLDKYGPRICGVVGSILIAFGCIFLANGTLFPFDAYITGYLLLALGGPFTFISSFQLSNIFPERSGAILACLTGAFDASSAVFLIYRIIYNKTAGAFNLHKFFTVFLVVPLFIFLVQIFLMPAASYKSISSLAFIAEEGGEAEEAAERQVAALSGQPHERGYGADETSQLLNRRRQSTVSRRNYSIVDTTGDIKATISSKIHDVSGIRGVMHDKTAWQQVKSWWFVLITLYTVQQMLRINYFVATVRSQYTFLLGSYSKAVDFNGFFDMALPLGGLIAVPFVGIALDNFSTKVVFSALTVAALFIGIMGILRNVIAGYLNVITFVVLRPFFYTAVSDYCAKVFGFENFGRVYGLVMCIAGVSNFLQAPIDSITQKAFKGDPRPVNIGLFGIGFLICLLLILYISIRARQIQRQNLEEEAESSRPQLLPGPN